MEFFEVIEKRYTHKEVFLSEPVPREHLELIARAGLAAPNGRNEQAVSLIIVDDKETLGALCEVASSPGLRSAPAAIVVLNDPSTQAGKTVNYEKEDYSAAAENMLLAAVALGYASVWLDGILIKRKAQEGYLKVLGAPESFNVPVILPIGIPDGEGSRRTKKPVCERLFYNAWNRRDSNS